MLFYNKEHKMKKIILINSLFLAMNVSASERDFSTPTNRQSPQFPNQNQQSVTLNVHTLYDPTAALLPTTDSSVRTLYTTSNTPAFSGTGNTMLGSILAKLACTLTSQEMDYLQRTAYNYPVDSTERSDLLNHYHSATLAHSRAQANTNNRPAFNPSALPLLTLE